MSAVPKGHRFGALTTLPKRVGERRLKEERGGSDVYTRTFNCPGISSGVCLSGTHDHVMGNNSHGKVKELLITFERLCPCTLNMTVLGNSTLEMTPSKRSFLS